MTSTKSAYWIVVGVWPVGLGSCQRDVCSFSLNFLQLLTSKKSAFWIVMSVWPVLYECECRTLSKGLVKKLEAVMVWVWESAVITQRRKQSDSQQLRRGSRDQRKKQAFLRINKKGYNIIA